MGAHVHSQLKPEEDRRAYCERCNIAIAPQEERVRDGSRAYHAHCWRAEQRQHPQAEPQTATVN